MSQRRENTPLVVSVDVATSPRFLLAPFVHWAAASALCRLYAPPPSSQPFSSLKFNAVSAEGEEFRCAQGTRWRQARWRSPLNAEAHASHAQQQACQFACPAGRVMWHAMWWPAWLEGEDGAGNGLGELHVATDARCEPAYNAKEMPAALMGDACHVRHCAGGAMGSKECGRASKRAAGTGGTAATHGLPGPLILGCCAKTRPSYNKKGWPAPCSLHPCFGKGKSNASPRTAAAREQQKACSTGGNFWEGSADAEERDGECKWPRPLRRSTQHVGHPGKVSRGVMLGDELWKGLIIRCFRNQCLSVPLPRQQQRAR